MERSDSSEEKSDSSDERKRDHMDSLQVVEKEGMKRNDWENDNEETFDFFWCLQKINFGNSFLLVLTKIQWSNSALEKFTQLVKQTTCFAFKYATQVIQ
jgi:hypothetical protein